MVQQKGTDEIESSKSSGSSRDSRSFREQEDENELQLAAIERLPTYKQHTTALFDQDNLINNSKEDEETRKTVKIDAPKLGALERHVFINKLLKKIEEDNYRLLFKQRERIDRLKLFSSDTFLLVTKAGELNYNMYGVEQNYLFFSGWGWNYLQWK